VVNLNRLEQHIKRPAGVVGLPGAAAGPTLCNRDGQEHFSYAVVEEGTRLPRLLSVRLWCPVCLTIHLLGGEPLKGQSRLGGRHGHSSALKPFFQSQRRGVYEDTSGRFRAEQVGEKLRVTDQAHNRVIGSPRTMTGAIGLVSQYLAREKGAALAPEIETEPQPAPTSQGLRKARHSRPEPPPFNPPRLIQTPPPPAPAGAPETVLEVSHPEPQAPEPRETLFAEASLPSTAPEAAGEPPVEPVDDHQHLVQHLKQGVRQLPDFPIPSRKEAAATLRSVLVAAMREADGDGFFTASLLQLGKAAGVSRVQAGRYMKKLIDGGYVETLGRERANATKVYLFVRDPYALLELLPYNSEEPAPPRVGEYLMVYPELVIQTGADPAALDAPPAPVRGRAEETAEGTQLSWEPGGEPPDARVMAGQALAKIAGLEELLGQIAEGLMDSRRAQEEQRTGLRELHRGLEELRGTVNAITEKVLTLQVTAELTTAEVLALKADRDAVTDWLGRTFGYQPRRRTP
jgi:hypothetical protein